MKKSHPKNKQNAKKQAAEKRKRAEARATEMYENGFLRARDRERAREAERKRMRLRHNMFASPSPSFNIETMDKLIGAWDRDFRHPFRTR